MLESRLLGFGITTPQQLCALSVEQMGEVWGGKYIGQVWWHRLRGDDIRERPTRRSTIGHSRVLPPEWRDDRGAREILLRLIEKAAARLRHLGYWAGSLDVSVHFLGGGAWGQQERLSPCQDTSTLLHVADEIWRNKPAGRPLKVSVVLSHLVADQDATPSLWETDRNLTALSHAMDQINQRFGIHSLYFAILHGVRDEAPTRIAFNQIPDLDLVDA